jgi:hypothetical protein
MDGSCYGLGMSLDEIKRRWRIFRRISRIISLHIWFIFVKSS